MRHTFLNAPQISYHKFISRTISRKLKYGNETCETSNPSTYFKLWPISYRKSRFWNLGTTNSVSRSGYMRKWIPFAGRLLKYPLNHLNHFHILNELFGKLMTISLMFHEIQTFRVTLPRLGLHLVLENRAPIKCHFARYVFPQNFI